MSTEASSPAVLKTKNGYYYGTTKGKWWKRYTKDKWLLRGNSEMWVDGEGVHFRRYMTKEVMTIPADRILDVQVGNWHAGKWAGVPVIKVLWGKDDLTLDSGFSISRSKEETGKWVQAIRDMAHR